MDLRQLEIVVAVAEELHFGRAAERVHLSQPALTQAVARMERQLGTRLFDRSTRVVQPTAAGQALIPRARAVLAEVAAAEDLVRRTGRGELGTVRMGVVGSAMLALVPAGIRALREEFPDLRLDLTEAVGAEQVVQLREGRLDLGLLHCDPHAPPSELDATRVSSERLAAVVAADHKLAGRGAIRLSELSQEPLVAIRKEQEVDTQRLYLTACSDAGFVPVAVEEVTSLQGLLGMVAAGTGWAFVSQSVAAGMRREQLRFLDLSDVGTALPTSVVWDPRQLTAAAAVVRDTLIGLGETARVTNGLGTPSTDSRPGHTPFAENVNRTDN